MKNTFINASNNKEGRTAQLGRQFFKEQSYQTINLLDYDLRLFHENRQDDFAELLDLIENSDNLVIGTPIWWSDMSSYLKLFIDRLSLEEAVISKFKGAKLTLILDGSAPEPIEIAFLEHVMKHIAYRFKMEFQQTITG
ncbi:MAG: NAD(P)H-dependent oxidoreductase [Streptococcaceae bacterium]|jgi:multimeric flavodoxin WrbA|nr:NAD(P)H-dependent oxidoreductase [Streptococcaceae bacterium]